MIKFSVGYKRSGVSIQKVVGISMTEPNQSLTIAEILRRYVGGEPVRGSDVDYEVDDRLDDNQALQVYGEDIDNPDDLTQQLDRSEIIEHEKREKRRRSERKKEEDEDKAIRKGLALLGQDKPDAVVPS